LVSDRSIGMEENVVTKRSRSEDAGLYVRILVMIFVESVEGLIKRRDDGDEARLRGGYAATDEISAKARIESSGPEFNIRPGGGNVRIRSYSVKEKRLDIE